MFGKEERNSAKAAMNGFGNKRPGRWEFCLICVLT
jgi:hypothetical protein